VTFKRSTVTRYSLVLVNCYLWSKEWNKQQGGASYEAATSFKTLDASEKYQLEIHRLINCLDLAHCNVSVQCFLHR
jgi:hypothetical protein